MPETEGQKPDILDQITGVPPDVVAAARLFLKSAGAVIPSQEYQDGIAGIVTAHQAPATIIMETPEDEEWRRQTDGLIGKGFHEALKYPNPEAYRLIIPKFSPIPDEYKECFNRHLAVEPRIGLSKLHSLANIAEFIDPARITNIVGRFPRRPYIVCLQSGPVELVVGTFDQAMAKIPRNGIATPLIEADFAYLRYPELFQPWIDAGSSRCGADNVLCLDVSGGGPKIRTRWVDFSNGYWRLLSRGKKTWIS